MVGGTRVVVPKNLLLSCLRGSKNTHPREFIAVLAGKTLAKTTTVTKILLPPFAETDEFGAWYDGLHFPLLSSVVGTFHSHPEGGPKPSPEDLLLFSRSGRAHLISGAPYSLKTTVAYDERGKKSSLVVKQ